MNWLLQKNDTEEKNSSKFVFTEERNKQVWKKSKKVREFSNTKVMTAMR
jgi:hypothetical protein